MYNEEYRHTSLIATLRKTWGLGEAFTGRDASARPFDHVFSRATPRDPGSWAVPTAHPVPEWTADPEVIGQALSSLGKGLVPAFIGMARQLGCRSRPNSTTRKQPCRPAASSASCGTSPATSSRSYLGIDRASASRSADAVGP